jgi:hypothetical protein
MDLDSIEMAHTWSEEQISEKISELLPSDWRFYWEYDHKSRYTEACYKNDQGLVVWKDANPARNLVFLNALLWLWLRKTKPKPSALWSKGSRPQGRPVINMPDSVVGTDSPEPGDLSSEEIEELLQKSKK